MLNRTQKKIMKNLKFLHFQDMFKEVGFDMDADTIIEWLGSDSMEPGVQVFTDSEICELVSKSASENEVQSDDDSEEDV